MTLLWWEYAMMAAIFAGILGIAGLYVGYRVLPKQKVSIQKTIGGAIGNFMTNLANQAAEEEGGSPSGSFTGALELGGFKIDPSMIKSLRELYKMAKDIGIIGPGGLLGGAGGSGGGSGSGKIGL